MVAWDSLTGRVWCDPCIVPLVKALNDAGMRTIASCCGHGCGIVNPVPVLAALRAIHPDIERFGLHGGCFQVYLLLREIFSEAEPWYDGNHVITKIGDRFWDVRGEVIPNGHLNMKDDALLFNRAYWWNRPLQLPKPESDEP